MGELRLEADHPNAALPLLDGHKPADTLVVEMLSRPRYNHRRRTMRYIVRRLGQATSALSGFEAARDRRVPRRFYDVSLFIDATGESGDHDALPHIPATDPATVPPDQGTPARTAQPLNPVPLTTVSAPLSLRPGRRV